MPLRTTGKMLRGAALARTGWRLAHGKKARLPGLLRWLPLRMSLGGWALLGAGSLLRRLRHHDLRGQVVLITGGTRGLGLALAREFGRQGARIVLCARDDAELTHAQAGLRAQGIEALALSCDVADARDVQRMIAEATERLGRVDVLVNNAGVIMTGAFSAQTAENFREAMDIMFWGMYNTTMASLPQMRARRSGHIVNVTSIGGKVSVPHLMPYSAAKFAATGFSEGLHAELAREGIHVLTVVPGLMRTGSFVNALFTGDHRAEYTWFSISDSLPFISMSASHAARRIVDATRRGEAEIILSPAARALATFHGVAPALTSRVMAVVNRFLPGTGATSPARYSGWQSETALSDSPLTALSRKPIEDLNQTEPVQPGASATT
ncbi:MAG TPA: SDR family NAD(P)-dependent oxidoreductase [Ktedonobacterales bacterium]